MGPSGNWKDLLDEEELEDWDDDEPAYWGPSILVLIFLLAVIAGFIIFVLKLAWDMGISWSDIWNG